MTSAERKRRYRERRRKGVVRIAVELDRLWWAEALWQGGFIANPDEDDRATLQAATQVYLDTVIEIARDEGRVPQALRRGCYVPTKRRETDSKEPTP